MTEKQIEEVIESAEPLEFIASPDSIVEMSEDESMSEVAVEGLSESDTKKVEEIKNTLETTLEKLNKNQQNDLSSNGDQGPIVNITKDTIEKNPVEIKKTENEIKEEDETEGGSGDGGSGFFSMIFKGLKMFTAFSVGLTSRAFTAIEVDDDKKKK